MEKPYRSLMAVAALVVSCYAPPLVAAEPAAQAVKTVLLVTADNMNANVKAAGIGDLMKREVTEFSAALKTRLEAAGKSVTAKAFTVASEQDIAQAIAAMPEKPEVLVQVYWVGKQGSLYVVADALSVKYTGSNSVHFEPVSKQEYISIGVTAKPTDTPENHASDFARYLTAAAH